MNVSDKELCAALRDSRNPNYRELCEEAADRIEAISPKEPEYKHDSSLDNVRMIFKRENGETVLWNPADCEKQGTPVDDDTGDDLEYVGLYRI